MRALILERTAADFAGLSLRDFPVPAPAEGEVVVQVKAAAATFVDLLMCAGAYQFKPGLPYVLGGDFSGLVVGEGTRFAAGDAVMGMNRGGAFATHIAVPERQLAPKPDAFDFAQAAAFGQSYLTAYVALVRHGGLAVGDWLLVHGASGGVGLAAVDLGRRMGAKIIATSASDEKLQLIDAEYAPDALLNIRGGFRERVKEITGGGADIVYDPVGADVFDESVRCVRYGGRYLIIGFAGGRIPTIAANYPLIKGFSLIGVRAGEHGRRFPDKGREDRIALSEIAASGGVSPHVHARFALEDWRAAFEMMKRREPVGRVILEPGR
ncbi:NADPH:quinone oxidoreductase family protein [Pacificimonas sp. WHA3]|uniref:NADPH:quinone oxidoreductase family protein n=1 Tax=Pacificimonas pallii TaxID=2827236 RepID=A0ABS6SDE4_9SPHN|nr:NADPH:quinone oxidoreductase family protein [Pacificimonas pallii]MBV7256275.1 NADPH:quinone oxidoreductase family protein [Pacificimonas pallii]